MAHFIRKKIIRIKGALFFGYKLIAIKNPENIASHNITGGSYLFSLGGITRPGSLGIISALKAKSLKNFCSENCYLKKHPFEMCGKDKWFNLI